MHEDLSLNDYLERLNARAIDPNEFVAESGIERVKQGYAMGRELWLYDIASAYPFAMLHLPSMRDGKWIAHKFCPRFRLGELAGIASQANILSTFRIKWKFPATGADGRTIPFNPFPYRTKRGNILFPSAGHAWITRDELLRAIKWVKRFFGEREDTENMITVEEWSEFVPGNDEWPYGFVAEL